MACVLSSGGVTLELLVTSWTTTLNTSASPVVAQRNNWFGAWTPDHPSMTVTFRQGPQDTQKAASAVLRQWAQTNARVTLTWPERGWDLVVLVSSAAYRRSYDRTVTDLTVTFALMTNLIYDHEAAMTVSSNMLGMIDADTVSLTLDDIEADSKRRQEEALLADYASRNKQWDGYTVSYEDGGLVRVQVESASSRPSTTVNKPLFAPTDTPLFGPVAPKRYDVYTAPLSMGFVNVMSTGDSAAIRSWLEANSKSVERNTGSIGFRVEQCPVVK